MQMSRACRDFETIVDLQSELSTCFSPAGSRTQKPLVILNLGTNNAPGVGKVINQLQGNLLLICGFAFAAGLALRLEVRFVTEFVDVVFSATRTNTHAPRDNPWARWPIAASCGCQMLQEHPQKSALIIGTMLTYHSIHLRDCTASQGAEMQASSSAGNVIFRMPTCELRRKECDQ